MSHLVSFFVAFWEYLPWIAIGLMGALAWRQRQESKALMLQAAGAGASFVLGMGKWLINTILVWMGSTSIDKASNIIFEFLLFLALLAFAAGYCGERFARRKAAQVTATPAQP